ncbi:helix-turn-helix transcriptional regulator [Bacteriovorax sp. BSW11_IV]|uniref:helix-turn-helix transcriptional regulator n=1 Tax=Bacteriovorax sp. BSW11_IV TaxID=1353529 RepID=UPI0012DCCDF5|nr:helix-turn-helix transcriptional regulator [Bacteriovorax sp. BSW11_IV]
MDIKIYNHGACIKGRMNDNEFHRHECLQVSMSKTDSTVAFKNRSISLPANNALVIAYNIEHKLIESEWVNVLVDNECEVGRLLIELMGSNEYVVIADHEIIEKLFEDPERELSRMNDVIRDEIKRAILLIKDHDHNCKLEGIAKEVGLSSDRFRKVFKEEVGITFKNYLRWQKLRRAFHLLTVSPETKLVDIAHQSGFSDQAHMTKIIRETFGYNPKNIKNNL